MSRRNIDGPVIDLMDMRASQDSEYSWILQMKDPFSQYIWLIALKNKSLAEVVAALKVWFGTNWHLRRLRVHLVFF